MNEAAGRARISTRRRTLSAVLLSGHLLASCLAAAGQAKTSGAAQRSTPAGERAALKDLEVMLERMAADPSENRYDRGYALQALARVREALDSWAQAGPYYEQLLKSPAVGPVSRYVLSGAGRARKAKAGSLAAVRAFCRKEGNAAARRSGEISRNLNRLNQVVNRAAKTLDRMASRTIARIRPLRGVRYKKKGDRLWKIIPPLWIYPPSPPKRIKPRKPKNRKPAPPRPATILRLRPERTVTPVLPKMNKRIHLLKK